MNTCLVSFEQWINVGPAAWLEIHDVYENLVLVKIFLDRSASEESQIVTKEGFEGEVQRLMPR